MSAITEKAMLDVKEPAPKPVVKKPYPFWLGGE